MAFLLEVCGADLGGNFSHSTGVYSLEFRSGSCNFPYAQLTFFGRIALQELLVIHEIGKKIQQHQWISK